MNSRVATALSVLFHPLILTTYLFAILFLITPDLIGVSALELPAIGSLLLLISMNTFVAPVAVIYYMHRFGLTSTLQVDHISERRLPYLACIIIYGLATYLFGWKLTQIAQLAPQIAILLASATLSLIMVFFINLAWKISAHATGLGGVLGTLGCLMLRFNEATLLSPFLLMLLLAGWVMSARLALHAHTPAQVWVGALVGILVSACSIFLLF